MRLVAERDLEAQCFNLALLPIRTINDECSTSTIFATNRCAGRFISTKLNKTVMKEMRNKIDAFFGKVANWIIIAIIIAIIWALIGKQISGKYMMYEDYYDQKVKSEHSK